MEPFLEQLREALAALNPLHLHAFGFDFARVSDLSVATLLAITPDMQRRSALTVEMHTFRATNKSSSPAPFYNRQNASSVLPSMRPGWAGPLPKTWGATSGCALRNSRLASSRQSSSPLIRLVPHRMPPLKVAFEDGAISISKNADHMSDLRAGEEVIRGIPRIPDVRTGGEQESAMGTMRLPWRSPTTPAECSGRNSPTFPRRRHPRNSTLPTPIVTMERRIGLRPCADREDFLMAPAPRPVWQSDQHRQLKKEQGGPDNGRRATARTRNTRQAV